MKQKYLINNDTVLDLLEASLTPPRWWVSLIFRFLIGAIPRAFPRAVAATMPGGPALLTGMPEGTCFELAPTVLESEAITMTPRTISRTGGSVSLFVSNHVVIGLRPKFIVRLGQA